MTFTRPLSPQQCAIGNLNWLLQRVEIISSAAKQQSDGDQASSAEADMAAIKRVRELIELHGGPAQ